MTTNFYLADGFICILARPPPKSNENRQFQGHYGKSMPTLTFSTVVFTTRKLVLWLLKSQKEKPTNALVGSLNGIAII